MSKQSEMLFCWYRSNCLVPRTMHDLRKDCPSWIPYFRLQLDPFICFVEYKSVTNIPGILREVAIMLCAGYAFMMNVVPVLAYSNRAHQNPFTLLITSHLIHAQQQIVCFLYARKRFLTIRDSWRFRCYFTLIILSVVLGCSIPYIVPRKERSTLALPKFILKLPNR